jgi:hypothetical protein
MEAKHAAETDPTYPNPKMLTDKPKRILLPIDCLATIARPRELYQSLARELVDDSFLAAARPQRYLVNYVISIRYRQLLNDYRVHYVGDMK